MITQIIPHRAKAVKRERRRGTPRSRFAVREDGERRGATGSYGEIRGDTGGGLFGLPLALIQIL